MSKSDAYLESETIELSSQGSVPHQSFEGKYNVHSKTRRLSFLRRSLKTKAEGLEISEESRELQATAAAGNASMSVTLTPKGSAHPELSISDSDSDNGGNGVPHSRFGELEKWCLVVQCAFTGFFSSIASNIYYPVLTVIEKEFHITEEQVNITVVVYFILQGLSPSIMGGFADSLGRRPVVLTSVLTYCAACIGLARAQTYTQIVALRCLQAAGIAPVIAINNGIMGDVTTKAERGGYVGYVSGIQVIGGALGALIGALLAARWDWRAIFWFLAIGSGISSVFSIFLLPETRRTIVGNGSIRPRSIQNIAPVLSLPVVQKRLHLNNPDLETLEAKEKVHTLAILDVLKGSEMDVVLFCSALQFGLWAAQQTSLSTALSKRYHYSVTKIGLCYLPGGICMLISMVSIGRYLNFAYQRLFNKHQTWLKEQKSRLLNENNNDDKVVNKILDEDPYYTFNLCYARLHAAFVTITVSSACFCAFGWCIQAHTSVAPIVVFSALGSLFSICIIAMSSTLMVDFFPAKASTATGCLNLFRCSIAAIYVACLSRMVKAIDYGGMFTLLSGISVLSVLPMYWVVRRGKELSFEKKKADRALAFVADKQSADNISNSAESKQGEV